jgi:anti-anti-sigma factor
MPEPDYRCLRSAVDRGVLVLTITAPVLLDEAVVDALHQDLVAAVAHHQPRRVILDFQNVRALGSGAFRPVISLHRRVGELNGRLVLCGVANAVASVFHLTGLLSADPSQRTPFTAAPSLDEAVARLAAWAPDRAP